MSANGDVPLVLLLSEYLRLTASPSLVVDDLRCVSLCPCVDVPSELSQPQLLMRSNPEIKLSPSAQSSCIALRPVPARF